MNKEWKNIGIQWVLSANRDNFTSDTGIKIRKIISPVMKEILKISTKKHINIETKPNLEKDKPYIFISSHSYEEDIISSLATIDRPVYILIGSTDQIKHNPQLYAAWANGLIYVNRQSKESRKDCLLKMERILKNGTSVLIFLEGSLNNTPNSLVLGEGNIFASPYILAQRTGAQVVPIGNYNQYGSKEIYINYGNPINMVGRDKREALLELRDIMATMNWKFLEKTNPIITKRETLGNDYILKYYNDRANIYSTVKWSNEIDWDEELDHYVDKKNPFPKEIWESFKDVKVNSFNASVMVPILKKIDEYEKEDFNKYIKDYMDNKSNSHNKVLVKNIKRKG